ncbi:EAL domain-containing protein [Colwellia psychrerythraea]|uniref:Response regulator receiver modulated diguanylate cyclase/phosphodiesterase n=1 Tax=Colwellia psychrerythraea TaxID=28229 RepID=A0A099KYP4_COLPS|nr:EAL domain-containing protein [Colwellia psychrerythraea]KGJ95864.1 response regulator receiver modulated diguanylate cyclase/phosphodiesterase [Colwellia psychrerythraea]
MDLIASKILIVDDHHANRVVLEKLLQPLTNIDIYHAASGEETLALLIYHKFALILLDVNMPNMDGYEVAELISSTEAHKHTPIVMLTAHHSNTQNIIKAYQSGAVDYLTKPIEPTILINKVKQFVKLNQLHVKTEQLKAESELILECAGQGVLKLDDRGFIQFANSKSAQLLNTTPEKLCQSHFNRCFKNTANVEENLFKSIQDRLDKHNAVQLQNIYLTSNDACPCPVELTCSTEVNTPNASTIVLFQDITLRLNMEKKLTTLANYDPLTKLANRSYFHDQLERAINRSKRNNGSVILLMLDLDHFKQINDTLGHDIGDELLQDVAKRITDMLRETDISARLGGDEFAILLEDTSELAAEQVANKIVTIMSSPFVIQDKEIFIETSIGISHSKGGQIDKMTLLKWADIALYEAKSAGRNRYQRFVESMSIQREKQAFIQNKLRHIIEDNALDLHFQPQYSIKQKMFIGVESLVRWPESGYGDEIISPAVFIPISEQSHLIHEIGAFVLIESCKLLASWNLQADKAHLTVSVNLSAKQLNSPNFLDVLEEIISEYQFPFNRLILEITETAILTHTESVMRTIDALKSMGIKLALDDFGTGYSSLNYLQNIPFDVIKIDQCFTQRVTKCKKTSALIQAVMTIARVCEMEVVAEGVEELTQLEHILALGVDKVQGYYYSKPLSKYQVNLLLTTTVNAQQNHESSLLLK